MLDSIHETLQLYVFVTDVLSEKFGTIEVASSLKGMLEQDFETAKLVVEASVNKAGQMVIVSKALGVKQ
jgi:hypothetical protein